ncbi:M42 family metallopeptidase [Lignipirellula cremea]|uniref:Aminopeptidase YsdC n=1 Tax=Lignipirellula cremea TaxID=2528010 RepID=A0A518DW55_9BACT|nr:M42 family metallopeptidase [Lignipirellula cremea]QDU96067.1 Putative aminopeptidase YsdC [Lignipirellula cremea]
MEPRPLEFLQKLLTTPSPSGFEGPIQEVVREYVNDFADEVTTDLHGNLVACVNPGSPLRVMYAGHCDQIGMIVTHIDEQGYIYAQTIGGWDPQQLIGQRMTIWSASGPVAAVIARKAIHLLNDAERKQVVPLEELWLDIGAKDRDDSASQVEIGDPVTLQLGMQKLRNGMANAPGMDDKTGVWIVIEAARRAAAKGVSCSLYAVSTVAEEIGLRGARTSAFSIDPHVGIAVDVTHSTDCPTIDKRQRGEINLGKGPVIFRGPNMNLKVTERLVRLSREQEIPHQIAAVGRAVPNDANALQVNRGGMAVGLVGTPNRYMHSAVETVALADLENAANLLAAFACSLTDDEDFRP